MKKNTLRLIAVLCYVCGAVFFGYTAYICTYDTLSTRGILLLCALVVLSFLLATILRCNTEKARTQKRRLVRLFLSICFALYIIILFNQLFLGNQAAAGLHDANNFIPSRTLWRYFLAYQNGTIDLVGILPFVLGNAILFAPIGFFLPCLFRALQSAPYYFLTLTIGVLSFEALMFMINSQTLDVDRVILRLLGASLVYLLCKTQRMRRLMHRGNMRRN